MFTIKKNSELQNNLPFVTEKRLCHVQISNDNMLKIMNNLESNKAHDHDLISIQILKSYGRSYL